MSKKVNTPRPEPFVETQARKFVWKKSYTISLLAVASLLVAFFGWVQPQISGHLESDLANRIKIEVSSQLESPTHELSKVRDDVSHIKGELDVLIPFLRTHIPAQMKKYSSLPKEEFQSALPEFTSLVQVARSEKIGTPLATLSKLNQKLARADSNSWSYWPATAEFVSYRSLITAYPKFPKSKTVDLTKEKFPRCTDSAPKPAIVIAAPSPTTLTIKEAYYEHCQVALDDPEDARRINDKLKNAFPFLDFKQCVVSYHGGEIKITVYRDSETGKAFSSLFFEDSVFDLSVLGPLSSSGKDLLLVLLNNTSGTLKFTPPLQETTVPPQH